MPKVSFIIPYYNNEATIGETLNSVFAQSYSDYDVWIIDDGSGPAGQAELKKYAHDPRIHVLKQQNAGPSVARNLGIAHSTGEYLFFLDADDLCCETTIELAVGTLNTYADVGVVYGKNQYFGASNSLFDPDDFEHFDFLFRNPLVVSCMVRRQVMEEVGGFDNFYSKLGLEDWDLWLSIGQTKWKFKKLDSIFLRIRVNETSRTFVQANKNLQPIYDYLYKKHYALVVKQLKQKNYLLNDVKRLPEYKLGKFILAPFRFIMGKKKPPF